jgi:DNA-binding MltR family transcriptional regulator
MFDALKGSDDLTCVLRGVAALEQAFMSLLQQHLIVGETTKALFKGGGVLGEYSGCAKMAYCLGLISKTAYTNAERLGEIRNAFAHSHLPLNFNNEEIDKLCGALKLPSHLDTSDILDEKTKQSPRARFQVVTVAIWNRTMVNALGVQRPSPNTDAW